ncbi:MAG: hypothetical protein RID53_08720 [Coleofasciculus sp. B1-GNL1-01]|uniref:hypothetical protein n=1 Tax=Coleofasciculus sp. B1-GNL1-01 TaxID=3068484 RepID=UPI0032FAB6C6
MARFYVIVVTIGTVGRLSNREYRERCAARLAEIIMYPENSIGVGRIFIPSCFCAIASFRLPPHVVSVT